MKEAFILIVVHFIADFICQTDKMAINKSKSNVWLSRHVLAYGGIFIIPAIYLLGVYLGLTYVIFNCILHFITDYFTSRWTSRLWAKEKRHAFFVVIGFDQVIHYGCLFYTYYLFSSII